MLNRYQKSIMKKRDQIIMGYVKKGMTYKQVAEIMLRHHKIKITYHIYDISESTVPAPAPFG